MCIYTDNHRHIFWSCCVKDGDMYRCTAALSHAGSRDQRLAWAWSRGDADSDLMKRSCWIKSWIKYEKKQKIC